MAKYCVYCGNPLKENDKFCIICGKPVLASVKKQEKTEVEKVKEFIKDANKYRKSQEKVYQKKGFLENSAGLGKGKRWD
ncbi:unnamed protein product [marine sediment metagenome]|uniref:Zinc-ribbon domain-containing protein n=1 Tax=marine sediment metagenome TaxID=412755 RepID=X1SNH3_9ZZZZ